MAKHIHSRATFEVADTHKSMLTEKGGSRETDFARVDERSRHEKSRAIALPFLMGVGYWENWIVKSLFKLSNG